MLNMGIVQVYLKALVIAIQIVIMIVNFIMEAVLVVAGSCLGGTYQIDDNYCDRESYFYNEIEFETGDGNRLFG